ncbi:MFS transporter [Streptomyces sp. NPDC050528]|uniref:MFS transporter n=1 Tax=Streptomyces sp. NPDC050528 TaxID=3365623 RepID=UPI0037BC3265
MLPCKKKGHGIAAQGTVALVAAHTFVFFFTVSCGVILWVMVGEMFPFPFPIRAAAMSVATAFNWPANWAVTESFPRMADCWGRRAGKGDLRHTVRADRRDGTLGASIYLVLKKATA